MKKKFTPRSRYVLLFAVVMLLIMLDYFIYKKVLSRQADTAAIPHYNTIDNPDYRRRRVDILQNVRAVLNPGSTLKISKDSTGSKKILLDGDAFFHIPPGQDDSIVVYTRMLRIGTTGSDFRIRAHDESAGQTLEVLSGKTAVSKSYSSSFPDPEIPAAGEMVMINKDIDLMEKEKFDTAPLQTWLSDTLTFDRDNFQQVIRKLENWFDISFDFSGGPPPELIFNQQFYRAGLETVLDSLRKKARFSYRLDDRTVKIKF